MGKELWLLTLNVMLKFKITADIRPEGLGFPQVLREMGRASNKNNKKFPIDFHKKKFVTIEWITCLTDTMCSNIIQGKGKEKKLLLQKVWNKVSEFHTMNILNSWSMSNIVIEIYANIRISYLMYSTYTPVHKH